MTKMAAETMMQANGGAKYRYQCTKCGSKSRTKFIMIMHIITNHLGTAGIKTL